MARYFFNARYHGVMIVDDVGEEFATAKEAETHAAVVAEELGRNDRQSVSVSVHDQEGALISSKAAVRK
jgi:hypothetical protein